LETALRNTLSKGDASDPAFRQRVYRSAMTAMERALADHPDPDRRSRQRQRLMDAIRATEAHHRRQRTRPEASGRDEPPAVSVRPEPRRRPAPRPQSETPQLRAEPRMERASSGPSFPDIGGDDRGTGQGSRARRAPFALMLTAVVAVALLGSGAWWVFSTGAFQSTEERDTSVPNPPLELENESFPGSRDNASSAGPARIAARSEAESGWVTLFDPADPTTVTLEGNASAAIDSDPFGDFARMVSPTVQDVIGIDVPPGTLEMLAGKTAQFSFVARADDDAETQMSVTCELADLGECGRRRFDVIASDNEFLFSVDLPGGVGVSGPGRLKIVTDISGAGRAVKISSVRVRELKP
jgi:hypothetical protein